MNQESKINSINKWDVIWNFGATGLKIASSVILLPIILKKFPSEIVAIWSVFSAISALTYLLDFGFNSSFVRTITYIFSGSQELQATGYVKVYEEQKINYQLLKDTISAMKWFYGKVSIALFLLLITFGTIYIWHLTTECAEFQSQIIIAWLIFVFNNVFILYTMYYEALLQGRGLVKESKQIIVFSYCIYLICAWALIIFDMGLIALVTSQCISTILIRILSKKIFYDKKIQLNLNAIKIYSKKNILKIISPNAIKMGLTSLGSFFISRSAIFIGSMFLNLEIIASYGITTQIIGCIYSVASIYISTYIPKITNLRITNQKHAILKILYTGTIIALLIYLISTLLLTLVGPYILDILKSNTVLLSKSQIIALAIFSFLEMYHGLAGNILLTKNYVPFFIPSLVSGLVTTVLLLLLFKYWNIGIWSMILAPGIVQLAYQNWKWPMEVYKDIVIKDGKY